MLSVKVDEFISFMKIQCISNETTYDAEDM